MSGSYQPGRVHDPSIEPLRRWYVVDDTRRMLMITASRALSLALQ